MSVRRLAADALQPGSFAFSAQNLKWARETIKKYPKGKQASAVIPLLWRAQEQQGGWLPKPAMEHVAQMLGMSYIRVYEVATFYTMFQLSPVGRKAHVQVCGTTPCMLRGSEELIAVCKRKIAGKAHELSEDGDFSWEEVECLGACVNAPMVQIFKDTYEDLTPEALSKLLDALAADKQVTPGSQVERHNSAPAGGFTSLVDPDLYNGKGVMRPGAASARKPVAKKPAAKKTATKKPAARKAAAPAAKKAAPATKKPVVKKQAQPAGKPRAMKKPAKPDDLKLISGVGPKLEGVLNKLGVYKWAQIAKWTKKEIDWVDDYLSFKGRIERDNWIAQADALASGGAQEYNRRFGKKPR